MGLIEHVDHHVIAKLPGVHRGACCDLEFRLAAAGPAKDIVRQVWRGADRHAVAEPHLHALILLGQSIANVPGHVQHDAPITRMVADMHRNRHFGIAVRDNG
jgi:hypothetical protein